MTSTSTPGTVGISCIESKVSGVTGDYSAAKDASLKARLSWGNRMAVGWGALYVRMEKSCRGYVLSADTRLLRAKKCLLCTLTARSIPHGEYKWRKFVHADNSGVMSDMYERCDMNYTHWWFPSFSAVYPGTFKTDQARASSALLELDIYS
jgi:hypothetical protein